MKNVYPAARDPVVIRGKSAGKSGTGKSGKLGGKLGTVYNFPGRWSASHVHVA